MAKRLLDIINGVIKWVLIIMFIAMVIVVFLQVLFRFVLNQPLAWTEEMARYLLVWLTFLGAGYGMSVKAHPSIELLYEKTSGLVKKGLTIISAALIVFFFWQIIDSSLEFISRSMAQKSPALQIPMGYIYYVIPISSVLFIINLLYVTISEWRKEASS